MRASHQREEEKREVRRRSRKLKHDSKRTDKR